MRWGLRVGPMRFEFRGGVTIRNSDPPPAEIWQIQPCSNPIKPTEPPPNAAATIAKLQLEAKHTRPFVDIDSNGRIFKNPEKLCCVVA